MFDRMCFLAHNKTINKNNNVDKVTSIINNIVSDSFCVVEYMFKFCSLLIKILNYFV